MPIICHLFSKWIKQIKWLLLSTQESVLLIQEKKK